MTELMRCVRLDSYGPAEEMYIGEAPRPIAGPGEVLIRVHASGINRPDVSQREGNYPPPPGASELMGLELAGEIVGGDLAHRDNRHGFAVGSRVCALVAGGGYAQYCVAPLAQCLPVPDSLSMEQAASLPETYFTVWTNVFDRAGLGTRPCGTPETLLVHGAASGIGVAAIQIAKALGHTVYTTAGSDEKCEYARRLGADAAINYRTSDFVAVVNDLTEGKGVDVVLDIVAGDYINRNIQCLAFDGRLSMIAVLGGQVAEMDLLTFLFKRLTMTASTLRARPVEFKGDIAASLHRRVWPLLANGVLNPPDPRIFDPVDIVLAHQQMERAELLGKAVIKWV
ncbi:MAG: NAD(P)H-quinone oxidoreductase [Pseudomonas sp.]